MDDGLRPAPTPLTLCANRIVLSLGPLLIATDETVRVSKVIARESVLGKAGNDTEFSRATAERRPSAATAHRSMVAASCSAAATVWMPPRGVMLARGPKVIRGAHVGVDVGALRSRAEERLHWYRGKPAMSRSHEAKPRCHEPLIRLGRPTPYHWCNTMPLRPPAFGATQRSARSGRWRPVSRAREPRPVPQFQRL
jgi:hypothetical protein